MTYASGDRDDDRPPLDPTRAVHARSAPPWARVDVVDETDSTNADLLADATLRTARCWSPSTRPPAAAGWTAPGLAARGRADVLGAAAPDRRRPRTWGWLPLLAGLALLDAIVESTGVPSR